MHNDRLDDPRPAADAAEGVHAAVLALLKSDPPGQLLDAPAGEGAFALHARERGYTVVVWGHCPCQVSSKRHDVPET